MPQPIGAQWHNEKENQMRNVRLAKPILNNIQAFESDKIFLRTVVKRVDLRVYRISISYDIGYIVKSFWYNKLSAERKLVVNN